MAPHRALNAESPLRPTRSSKTGDEFKYQLEVYSVTGIQAGHDEFDAVLLADLIGEKKACGVRCVNSVVRHKTFDLQARPSLCNP